MVQNLKLDIIYHLTPSDFEMEFNLCGCCRMRMLSDKTTDKKSFVKALARDVARSRVIIACGPIFGADGLINIIATAIGSGVEVCDNKTYGINTDDEIKIINGSTPLVTPDGYFGGCIIESGPQTIIVLTENRAFRKAIMQNLIHPYIEEISYIPTSDDFDDEAVVTDYQPAVTEQETYITSPEAVEVYEDDVLAEITANEEHNIEFIMDGEEPAEETKPEAPTIDESYNLMYTEVETQEEIKSRYEDPYKPSESDNMFLSTPEDDDDEIPKNEKQLKKMNITIVILVLLILLSVLAIVYFIVLKPMTMGISTEEYVKEIFGLASSDTLI